MSPSETPASAAESLEVDGEIRRLAHLLSLGAEELDYLAGLPADELRVLRGQVTSSLFDHQTALARIAASTRIVPVALTASLAEKVFGPMLAARIAGLVDPDRAVDIAARLPVDFLADVAVELDPRRVGSILSSIPPDTVAAVTERLAAQEQWVAMGNFLAYLPPDATRAAMAKTDARALLHVSLVLEDKSRLSAWIGLADSATLAQVPEIAASEGLSEQLAALESWLSPEQRSVLLTR